MKKLLMGIIVVFLTSLTIGFMYLFTIKQNDNLTMNEANSYKNQIIKNEESISVKDSVNNKENTKNQEDKNNLNENDKTKDKEEIKKSRNSKESIKPNKENTYIENEKQKTSKVFKVNKHTLLQNLSMKEKIKLLYICRRLSTTDIGNINEYMKSSNEIQASVEIFKILRQSLPKEDYSEIKNILDPYVNIDYIESNI